LNGTVNGVVEPESIAKYGVGCFEDKIGWSSFGEAQSQRFPRAGRLSSCGFLNGEKFHPEANPDVPAVVDVEP